jgi:hypothetical protein
MTSNSNPRGSLTRIEWDRTCQSTSSQVGWIGKSGPILCESSSPEDSSWTSCLRKRISRPFGHLSVGSGGNALGVPGSIYWKTLRVFSNTTVSPAYMDPGTPKAFPPDPTERCRIRLFERSVTVTEGTHSLACLRMETVLRLLSIFHDIPKGLEILFLKHDEPKSTCQHLDSVRSQAGPDLGGCGLASPVPFYASLPVRGRWSTRKAWHIAAAHHHRWS